MANRLDIEALRKAAPQLFSLDELSQLMRHPNPGKRPEASAAIQTMLIFTPERTLGDADFQTFTRELLRMSKCIDKGDLGQFDFSVPTEMLRRQKLGENERAMINLVTSIADIRHQVLRNDYNHHKYDGMSVKDIENAQVAVAKQAVKEQTQAGFRRFFRKLNPALRGLSPAELKARYADAEDKRRAKGP